MLSAMANFALSYINSFIMTKKAMLALLLAIALPLMGYLLFSYMSKRDLQMPQRFFYDSVMVKTERGKTTFDTAWHQIKNIELTNQLGNKVSLDELRGKVIVMDFFFTRCPVICPTMTKSMKKLQTSFLPSDTLVQFVSISVDPEHDDVERLNWWAEKFGVNPDNWWLGTGNKDSIYNFALTEIKASVADTGVDTAFIHTENFFLIDREGIIRGWYNGTDEQAQLRLVNDIPLLILEKNRKRSFGQFVNSLFNR